MMITLSVSSVVSLDPSIHTRLAISVHTVLRTTRTIIEMKRRWFVLLAAGLSLDDYLQMDLALNRLIA
jgi:hypothetical protein